MAYWLLKSEPGTWSWEDQMRAGRTHWDGVRNAQALGNMRRMAVGDEAFFYHSGKERRIVGIVRIARAFHDDPEDPKSGLVDVETVAPLKHPVTLAGIKADPAFATLALVRQPRLSVMPVTPGQWHRLLEMGGMAG